METVTQDVTCTIETQPMFSPLEMQARLQGIRGHIGLADKWAGEHLRMFPNLKMVSINIGANILLQFGVTLIWQRKTD